jgi:hypothetical protein
MRRLKIGGVRYQILKKSLGDGSAVEDNLHRGQIVIEKYQAPAARWQSMWFGALAVMRYTYGLDELSDKTLRQLAKGISDVIFINGDLRKCKEFLSIGSTYYLVEDVSVEKMREYCRYHITDAKGDQPWGVINYAMGAVKLRNDQTPDLRWGSLWHETVHGICDDRGIRFSRRHRRNEVITEIVAQFVTQILEDNPWVVYPLTPEGRPVV